MPNVLLNVPDLVLMAIDKEVAEENNRRANAGPVLQKPKLSKLQPLLKKEQEDLIEEAYRIRREKGLQASNDFLAEKNRKRKVAHRAEHARLMAEFRSASKQRKLTRTALATQLLILGFEMHERQLEEAKIKNNRVGKRPVNGTCRGSIGR